MYFTFASVMRFVASLFLQQNSALDTLNILICPSLIPNPTAFKRLVLTAESIFIWAAAYLGIMRYHDKIALLAYFKTGDRRIQKLHSSAFFITKMNCSCILKPFVCPSSQKWPLLETRLFLFVKFNTSLAIFYMLVFKTM